MKKLLFYFLLLINSFVGSAAEIQLADPTIYYDEGVYYLTGTLMGNGFRMYQSTDLVHWTLCGNASEGLALHKNDVFGDKWFWAPKGRDLSRSAISKEQIARAMDSALRRNVINHAPTPAGLPVSQRMSERYKSCSSRFHYTQFIAIIYYRTPIKWHGL